MTFVKALILGIVQGITEFIPVSSAGHAALLSGLVSFSEADHLLFDIALHIGTLVAMCLMFRKELGKMATAGLRMIRDICGNVKLFCKTAGSHSGPYRKILTGNYRYMTTMIVIAMVPTVLIGLLLHSFAEMASHSLMFSGMGFFITAVILLVVDRVDIDKLPPREISPVMSLFIGFSQGVSVIPGISRAGLTVTTSLLCGMNRKTALKFSYVLAIPTTIGALIYRLAFLFEASAPMIAMVPYCLVGGIASAVTGCFVIKKMMALFSKASLKYFSYYCFIVGMIAMVSHFVQKGV